MPSSFVALPVGQGDAFLVSNTDFSALVDGGHSGRTLLQLLSKHRRSRALNVVACTHNDADHAEGLIGLLASQEIKVCEVWLPGQWTTRLRDLLVAPEAFMLEVLHDIDTLSSEDIRMDSLSDLADRLENVETVPGESSPIVQVLDEAVEASTGRPTRLLRHITSWWAFPFHHRTPLRLFWEAIDATERIRKLAYLAWQRAVAVRWFDVTYSPATITTDATKLLVPVNAKEIVRISSYKLSALQFLALSVSNKRSLCFEFRPTPEKVSVLLTADSDLNFKDPINWSSGMIVTAPHHGSEANVSAYDRASQECPSPQSILWVRSDGRFRSRPGAAFLQQIKRYCTRCRPYGHGEQAVHFTSTAAGWITRRTKPCRCV